MHFDVLPNPDDLENDLNTRMTQAIRGSGAAGVALKTPHAGLKWNTKAYFQAYCLERLSCGDSQKSAKQKYKRCNRQILVMLAKLDGPL
jgi:hypothetical protein